MKKVLAISCVALMAVGFTSCSKTCGSCDTAGSIEYCKGNVVEDAAYDAAKSNCSLAGGTWTDS